MSDWLIRLKRGLLSALPVLNEGEPGYVTDQGRMWVGTAGNGAPVDIPPMPGVQRGGLVVLGPANYFGTGITSSGGADTIYFMPMVVPYRMEFDTFQLRVVAADGVQQIRLGIYANDHDEGLPAELLVDSGVVNPSSTGPADFSVTPFTLDAGWYWSAFNTDGGSATFACTHDADVRFDPVMLPDRIGNTVRGFSRAFTFAAMPDPAGATTYEGSTTGTKLPIVGLKRS